MSDLDGLSWAAALATLALCGLILGVILWNRKHEDAVDLGGVPNLAIFLGILCLIGAVESYSSLDAVPRRTVEGSAHIVHVTRGRHSYTYYVCVDTCSATGGYALRLDERAGDALSRDPKGTRYRFTYPDKPVGGAVTGVSLEVERIAEAGSGAVIYQQDLRNHPFRIASYLGDLLLAIFTFFLWANTANSSKSVDEKSEEDEDSGGGVNEMTSLHLE